MQPAAKLSRAHFLFNIFFFADVHNPAKVKPHGTAHKLIQIRWIHAFGGEQRNQIVPNAFGFRHPQLGQIRLLSYLRLPCQSEPLGSLSERAHFDWGTSSCSSWRINRLGSPLLLPYASVDVVYSSTTSLARCRKPVKMVGHYGFLFADRWAVSIRIGRNIEGNQ